MKRRTGLHRIGTTDHQRAIANTDIAVSRMVMARDQQIGCITCGATDRKWDNGHFRLRGMMTTRFHPKNINKQCQRDNRFAGGLTYEYSVGLDKKYGRGTAKKLEQLSRKTESFSVDELSQLRSAARISPNAYEQLYYQIRPAHQL